MEFRVFGLLPKGWTRRRVEQCISARSRFRFEILVLSLRFSATSKAPPECERHCSSPRHFRRAPGESRETGLCPAVGLLMTNSLMISCHSIRCRECGESCATSRHQFILSRRSRISHDLSYHKMTPDTNALEPTVVEAFIITITDIITSPASVTPLSTAVAEFGRFAP
jgi:hypothetical protein